MQSEAEIRLIEREQRWEVESVERGIARYRRMVAEADNIADTGPGVALMDTILKGIIPAIEAAQQEALEGLTAGNKAPWVKWWYPMLCLDAGRMAVITARTVLSRAESAQPVTGVAKKIAECVRLQREFDLWKDAQAKAEKEAKEAGEKAVNVYKLMLSRVKQVNRRTVARWMKKGEEYDKVDWSIDTKVHFGSKLIEILVEHGGGCFEVKLVALPGRKTRTTERQIIMTPICRDYLEKQHAACELTRPWLLPMLCPPKEWRAA